MYIYLHRIGFAATNKRNVKYVIANPPSCSLVVSIVLVAWMSSARRSGLSRVSSWLLGDVKWIFRQFKVSNGHHIIDTKALLVLDRILTRLFGRLKLSCWAHHQDPSNDDGEHSLFLSELHCRHKTLETGECGPCPGRASAHPLPPANFLIVQNSHCDKT
jgi:hypothetical protein